jgi:chromate transporter
MKPYSLLDIFLIFLRLGSTSFGGYMALVAIVHQKFVEKDKSLPDQSLSDMVTFATFLPGPVAVNVVSNVGYHFAGWLGAVVAFVGILTPAFCFMLVFYMLYSQLGDLEVFSGFFAGASYVVVGLIFSTGVNMVKKDKGLGWVLVMIPLIFTLLFFVKAYWQMLAILLASGIVGWILFRNKTTSVAGQGSSWWTWTILLAGALVVFLLPTSNIYFDIVKTFSTVSLTLFGGGYVMIPMLHELLIEGKNWLTEREFLDAIAMGQLTPGPILISSAFVGFKLAGWTGGLVATLSIFLPSAVTMVLLFNNVKSWLSNRHVRAFFSGMKMAIIALILYSGVRLLIDLKFVIAGLITAAIAFALIFFRKVNPVYLVLLAGALFSLSAYLISNIQ